MQAYTTLPILPYSDITFPGMPLVVDICDLNSRKLIEDVIDEDLRFGLVLNQPQDRGMSTHDISVWGCKVRITSMENMAEGKARLWVTGEQSFRVLRIQREQPYLVAETMLFPEFSRDDAITDTRIIGMASKRLEDYLRLLMKNPDLDLQMALPRSARALANTMCAVAQVEPAVKLRLLELHVYEDRLRAALGVLESEIMKLKNEPRFVPISADEFSSSKDSNMPNN